MRTRSLVGWIAGLGLAGCAGDSYTLGQGDANYDAIAQATKECRAKGGEIQLKTGYDSRELSSYECRIEKAR
jgi:hypothetical protein